VLISAIIGPVAVLVLMCLSPVAQPSFRESLTRKRIHGSNSNAFATRTRICAPRSLRSTGGSSSATDRSAAAVAADRRIETTAIARGVTPLIECRSGLPLRLLVERIVG
jgi:hypothetical protein